MRKSRRLLFATCALTAAVAATAGLAGSAISNCLPGTGTGTAKITGLSPTGGTAGTVVTITGENLGTATAVSFNGTWATFSIVDASHLSATVPAGATSGQVTVTVPSGSLTAATTFTVTTPSPTSPPPATPPTTPPPTTPPPTSPPPTVTAPAPTITAVAPGTGKVGTALTISGANLTGVTSVDVGIVPAPFTVVSATRITATVPVRAIGGPVKVTRGSTTATSTTSFGVLAEIARVAPGAVRAGRTLKLTGTSLALTQSVTVGGSPAPFTVLSPTQLRVVVPAVAVDGPVRVRTAAGETTSVASVDILPRADLLSPSVGAPGSVVIVTGSGFAGTSSVTLRDLPVPYSVVSPTQLRVTIPVAARSGRLVIRTPNGVTRTRRFAIVRPA
jgi:hypothetical protein